MYDSDEVRDRVRAEMWGFMWRPGTEVGALSVVEQLAVEESWRWHARVLAAGVKGQGAGSRGVWGRVRGVLRRWGGRPE